MMLTSPALSGGRLGTAETNLPTSLCVVARPPRRDRNAAAGAAMSPGFDTGVNPRSDDGSGPCSSSSGQLPWFVAAAVSAVGASDTTSETSVGI